MQTHSYKTEKYTRKNNF